MLALSCFHSCLPIMLLTPADSESWSSTYKCRNTWSRALRSLRNSLEMGYLPEKCQRIRRKLLGQWKGCGLQQSQPAGMPKKPQKSRVQQHMDWTRWQRKELVFCKSQICKEKTEWEIWQTPQWLVSGCLSFTEISPACSLVFFSCRTTGCSKLPDKKLFFVPWDRDLHLCHSSKSRHI